MNFTLPLEYHILVSNLAAAELLCIYGKEKMKTKTSRYYFTAQEKNLIQTWGARLEGTKYATEFAEMILTGRFPRFKAVFEIVYSEGYVLFTEEPSERERGEKSGRAFRNLPYEYKEGFKKGANLKDRTLFGVDYPVSTPSWIYTGV